MNMPPSGGVCVSCELCRDDNVLIFVNFETLEFVVLFFKEYDQNVPNKIIFGMH